MGAPAVPPWGQGRVPWTAARQRHGLRRSMTAWPPSQPSGGLRVDPQCLDNRLLGRDSGVWPPQPQEGRHCPCVPAHVCRAELPISPFPRTWGDPRRQEKRYSEPGNEVPVPATWGCLWVFSRQGRVLCPLLHCVTLKKQLHLNVTATGPVATERDAGEPWSVSSAPYQENPKVM